MIFLLKISDSHMLSWRKVLQVLGLCKPEDMTEQLISLQRKKQYQLLVSKVILTITQGKLKEIQVLM